MSKKAAEIGMFLLFADVKLRAVLRREKMRPFMAEEDLNKA